jgi:hypothetical protein
MKKIQVHEIKSYEWECPDCMHENLGTYNPIIHGCVCERCESGFEADELCVNEIKQKM